MKMMENPLEKKPSGFSSTLWDTHNREYLFLKLDQSGGKLYKNSREIRTGKSDENHGKSTKGKFLQINEHIKGH